MNLFDVFIFNHGRHDDEWLYSNPILENLQRELADITRILFGGGGTFPISPPICYRPKVPYVLCENDPEI